MTNTAASTDLWPRAALPPVTGLRLVTRLGSDRLEAAAEEMHRAVLAELAELRADHAQLLDAYEAQSALIDTLLARIVQYEATAEPA